MVTVVEDPNSSVGIAEQPSATIGIFPSPATTVLYVDAPSKLTGRSATVTDLSGKVVARPVLEHGALDVSGLASGIYLLKVETTAGSKIAKFIKN
jgi:hypothetical protein